MKIAFTFIRCCSTYKNVNVYGISSRIVLPDDNLVVKFPTVSTIVSKTMTPESIATLLRWQKKKKQELGEEKFYEYMKHIKSLGQDIHNAIEFKLLKKEYTTPCDSVIKGYINSLDYFLNLITNCHCIESTCYHPVLKYKGRLDGIVSFDQSGSNLAVIDWKTVHTTKRVLNLDKAYDAPLQLAAYIGAYNSLLSNEHKKVTLGVIVYAYYDGYPADKLVLTGSKLEEYWEKWVERVDQYYNENK